MPSRFLPNGPNVTRLWPPQLQYDLWRAVVSRRDNCAVVLVVEGGRPEVD